MGAKLQAATECKSLLKKYLTKPVFDELKNKKTALGATLLDVIQSGVENLDSGVGVYAPDAEAYTLFAPLFDPIIENYHVGFTHSDKHQAKDFGDVNSLVNVDPEGQYVISTRVRCGRSMEGYPFNPCLTEAQYKEMEEKVSSTLTQLGGDHKGTFYPLTGMTKEVQQKLIDDHFLFKEGDRFLQAANACRYWPSGRGIYHNDAKTFLVWVNEEDHLRIISMQMGGDLGEVYRRLVSGEPDRGQGALLPPRPPWLPHLLPHQPGHHRPRLGPYQGPQAGRQQGQARGDRRQVPPPGPWYPR